MRSPFTCPTLAAWAGLVGAGACGAPPPSPDVEARGHFLVGGESSVFTPCGATSEPWWVDAPARRPGDHDSLAVFHEVLQAAPADTPPGAAVPGGGGYRRVYVRWRGTLRDSGGYGHLSAYRRQFTPRRAVDAHLPQPTDCR